MWSQAMSFTPDHATSPESSVVDPIKHQCKICGRSFRRVEHLRRHQLSHESQNLSTCSTCGKVFSRGSE